MPSCTSAGPIRVGGPIHGSAELHGDPGFADHLLPGRSRIAALLKATKLTGRYQKLSFLPTPAIHPQGAPHDEWERDAQGGMQVTGGGKVCLLTGIDVLSRWHRSRAILVSTQHIPRWRASQLLLRRAELSTGLPRRISFDHGMVCYDNTSPSPFPTRLHLWLLADGASRCASSASAVPPIMPRSSAHTKR